MTFIRKQILKVLKKQINTHSSSNLSLKKYDLHDKLYQKRRQKSNYGTILQCLSE